MRPAGLRRSDPAALRPARRDRDPARGDRRPTKPNRAAQFDQYFRPKPLTRGRWQRVWLAVQQDVTLPPISVVQIGEAYAIRDGHHRVSVARARGALTITALVG